MHHPILMPPTKGKSTKLYIFVSELTMDIMLDQEAQIGVEKAIYYLSRVLNDTETQYSE